MALYEIGTIVVGAASGLLALRHGVRLPMTFAACLFAAGCAISALAPSMPVLLAGRLLQGLGGGGLMALAFVAVGLNFAAHLMARVMGAVSTLWALSAFMGPLVGGLFIEFTSWRMGFWCFAAQAMLLAFWLFMRPDDRTLRPSEVSAAAFPAGRLVWLSLGVVAIAFGGVETGVLRTPLLVLLGGLCLAMFLWLDGRSGTARRLPQRPLSFRRPLGGALTMILCLTTATVAIGIVANATRIEAVDDAATLSFAAALFLACLPLALIGLVAMRAFVRHD